jgi:serine/threonine protein kinase
MGESLGDYTIVFRGTGAVGRAVPAIDSMGKSVRIQRFLEIDATQAEGCVRRAQQLCQTQTPVHPSTLRCLAKVRDPGAKAEFAVVYEAYEEDLHTFLVRRQSKQQHLTPFELLSILRQLIAGLAVWHPHKIAHGNIGTTNIVLARNGQQQFVFKIGDLDLPSEPQAGAERKDGLVQVATLETDMLQLGIIMYQLAALCSTAPALADIRTALTSPALRTRYHSVALLLDVVMQMIESDEKKRPTPKTVQLELAKIEVARTSDWLLFLVSSLRVVRVPGFSVDVFVGCVFLQ